MERRDYTRQDPTDLAFRTMDRWRREQMFGRAFNDLMRFQRDAATGLLVPAETLEPVLVGTVLRTRRLGLTPNDFRINLAEAQDQSFLRVGVVRLEEIGVSFDVPTVREGRDVGLQGVIDGTIKSYRNSGKPITTIPVEG